MADAQQHLAAILFADVAGYTKLMESDEAGTYAAWRAARDEIVAPTVADHKGRIVKFTGDGFLAEFQLPDAALACAVDLQHGFVGREPLKLRIGLHLGQVYAEGDDIYGDGVNVAARLEGLAEHGGICVSGAVRDLVHKKMPFDFLDGGKQALKHIAEPVQVWRVRIDGVTEAGPQPKATAKTRRDWKLPGLAAGIVVLVAAGGALAWRQPWITRVEQASAARMALPLPDKPSIAVMPFANLSDDKEQEYFAEGMADDIIVDLGQVSGLFVAARSATFGFKGNQPKPRDIAEQLGVRYVLDGSVRRVGEKLRVNVQLVDAIGGQQLWAERYDRDTKDIFAVQSEVTKRVVAELAVTLKLNEQERLARQTTTSLPSYELFLRAERASRQGDRGLPPLGKDGVLNVMTLLEKSIELDPSFAAAYAYLAFEKTFFIRQGYSDHPETELAEAFDLAKRAVALDQELALSHTALGNVYYVAGDIEGSIASMREAVRLQPSDSDAWAFLGFSLIAAGQGEEAIDAMHTAIRLSANYNVNRYRAYLGFALFTAGRYREYLQTDPAPATPPTLPQNVTVLLANAAAHAALGEMDQAHARIKQILDKYPDTAITTLHISARPYKRKEDLDRLFDLYRKAGLPENPPLK